jgi:hypothetical protein
MEDVTYVSSRAVSKRKATDDAGPRPSKRVQPKEESSTESSSESSSVSEDESDDDNETGEVGAAMSAVRISTEPQSAAQPANVGRVIKTEDQLIEEKAEELRRRDSLMLVYFEELETTLSNSLGQTLARRAAMLIGLTPRQKKNLLLTYIVDLEAKLMRKARDGHAALQTLQGSTVFRKTHDWTSSAMYRCIAKLKAIQVVSEALGSQQEIIEPRAKEDPTVDVARSRVSVVNRQRDSNQQQRIRALEDKVSMLETELEVQKRLRRELAKQKDITITDLRKAQENLTTAIQKRNEEIEALNMSRSSETPIPVSVKVKKEDKEVKRTRKALKGAEARLAKMHEHYDSLHDKNTIMLGKLTAMAQAGGFGTRGSLYRKELDSLKAPSLDELEDAEQSG